MLRKLLIAIVLLVLVFVAFIATRPAHFHIERSASIAASPETIYPHLADFHQWEAWSPWEKLDSTMVKTMTGEPMAVGSDYHWAGTGEVGEGRMTLTAAQPPHSLTIKLDFIKPFEATNTTLFTLDPEGEGTKVAWIMEGENGFMAKAMGLFMNMDQMVGGDFEKGLSALKQVTEAEAAAAAAAAPMDSTVSP